MSHCIRLPTHARRRRHVEQHNKWARITQQRHETWRRKYHRHQIVIFKREMPTQTVVDMWLIWKEGVVEREFWPDWWNNKIIFHRVASGSCSFRQERNLLGLHLLHAACHIGNGIFSHHRNGRVKVQPVFLFKTFVRRIAQGVGGVKADSRIQLAAGAVASCPLKPEYFRWHFHNANYKFCSTKYALLQDTAGVPMSHCNNSEEQRINRGNVDDYPSYSCITWLWILGHGKHRKTAVDVPQLFCQIYILSYLTIFTKEFRHRDALIYRVRGGPLFRAELWQSMRINAWE